MKKGYAFAYVMFSFSFVNQALAQCTTQAVMNITANGQVSLNLDAGLSTVSANTSVYAWEWIINDGGINNVFTTSYVNDYRMPFGLNKMCLTVWATDSVTGDSCMSTHCNIFAGAGYTAYAELEVTDDPVDPLTKHFFGYYHGGPASGVLVETLDFGDGTNMNVGATSYTYASPGTYLATYSADIGPYAQTHRTVKVDPVITNMNIEYNNFGVSYNCNQVTTTLTSSPPFMSGDAQIIYNSWSNSPPASITHGNAFSLTSTVPGVCMLQMTPLDSNGNDARLYRPLIINECGLTPDTAYGRVWADSDADGLMDTGEQGIAGKEVIINNYSALTDSTGYYEILVPLTTVGLSVDHNFQAVTFPGQPSYGVTGGSIAPGAAYNFGIADINTFISGRVFLDYNNDSIFNAGDVNQKTGTVHAHSLTSGLDYYAVLNATGQYQFAIPQGNYVLKVSYHPFDPLTITPDSIVINSSGGTFFNNNFALYSAVPGGNFSIDIQPAAEARPGFGLQMLIVLTNSGFDTTAGTVSFNYDPALFFDTVNSAAVIVDTIAHLITWTAGQVAPGTSIFLNAYFHVPVATPLGTILTHTASVAITPGYTDYDLSNNSVTTSHIVVGSFDPNDKIVTPSGYGSTGDIHHEQRLHYRINFQNTGTASAINVIVQDTIETDLDLSTFLMERASHAYQLVTNGRVLTWKFLGINLPDSNSNEPLSHGFIEFSINAVQGLPDGTEIQNQADIYFDFNEPVITNNTLNTLQTNITGLPEANSGMGLHIFPVPFTNHFTLMPILKENSSIKITLLDIVGKEIAIVFSGRYEAGMLINYTNKVLDQGVYVIRMDSGSQTLVRKIIK